MIEIQELQYKSEEQINDLLLKENTSTFSIYIPKSTLLFHSTNMDIAMDYAGLAYCGHLLNEVSDTFEYNYVNTNKHESILFIVGALDIKKLSNTIFEISRGYINVEDLEDEFEFHEGMSQYISDIEEGKLIPVCQDFFEVYLEMKEDDNEDDEE